MLDINTGWSIMQSLNGVKSLESENLSLIKDWAVNKIDLLHEADRHRNASALESEFYEWIHIPNNVEEIEYFYIDNINT